MTKETQERTLPVHPLEAKGAAKWLILPMMGVEVIVRQVGFKAVVQGGMLHSLRTGALTFASLNFANEANEKTRDGMPRYRGELDVLQALQMQRIARFATVRNAVAAPRFEELLEHYGGSEEFDDMGMGPDWDMLEAAVNELNPQLTTANETGEMTVTKAGERPVKDARAFPAESRGAAVSRGGKVRQKAK